MKEAYIDITRDMLGTLLRLPDGISVSALESRIQSGSVRIMLAGDGLPDKCRIPDTSYPYERHLLNPQYRAVRCVTIEESKEEMLQFMGWGV